MPKQVDHSERRRKLAEACWQVIREGGIENASVRNVADAAGMSLGSLRHYFSTQSELIAFSMRLVSERVNERIASLALSGELRQDILLLSSQLLPLDEDRRMEGEVWLALSAKSLADPELLALFREVHDELLQGFRKMTAYWLGENPAAVLSPEAELEARRFHALVDGLAIHSLLAPESADPAALLELIGLHLDRLRPS